MKKKDVCLIELLLPLQLELPAKKKFLYKHHSVDYAVVQIKEHLTGVHIIDIGNQLGIKVQKNNKVSLQFKFQPLTVPDPQLIFATHNHKLHGEIPAIIYYRSRSQNRENEYLQEYYTQIQIMWETDDITNLTQQTTHIAQTIAKDFLYLYKYYIKDTRDNQINYAAFGMSKIAKGTYTENGIEHPFPQRLIKSEITFSNLEINSLNHNIIPLSAPRKQINLQNVQQLQNAAVHGETIPYYIELFIKGLEKILAMDYRGAIIDFNMSFEIFVAVILRKCYQLLKKENIDDLFHKKDHFGIKNQMKHFEKSMRKLLIFDDDNKFFRSKYWDSWYQCYQLRNKIVHQGFDNISKIDVQQSANNIKEAINFLAKQINTIIKQKITAINLDISSIVNTQQIEPGSFRVLFSH